MWVGEEMKMGYFFKLPVSDCLIGKLDHSQCVKFVSDGVAEFEAVASAVNNHDRLVEENRRLTELAAQKASRADELYEALSQCVNELRQWQSDYDDFASCDFIEKQESLLERIKQESNDE